jgi:hypothetical protein
MKEEKINMNYLEIENKKGYFINKLTEKVEIEKIERDDLLFLLEMVDKEGSNFEMIEYEKGLLINPIQDIIYKNIYSKVNEFFENIDSFHDQINSLYKGAFEKY